VPVPSVPVTVTDRTSLGWSWPRSTARRRCPARADAASRCARHDEAGLADVSVWSDNEAPISFASWLP